MPNIKSARKRMQLSRKWRDKNRAKRSRIRTLVKEVRQADDAAAAREAYRKAVKLLDRAATKRLMHPNKVARMKSQLARHVNGLEG